MGHLLWTNIHVHLFWNQHERWTNVRHRQSTHLLCPFCRQVNAGSKGSGHSSGYVSKLWVEFWTDAERTGYILQYGCSILHSVHFFFMHHVEIDFVYGVWDFWRPIEASLRHPEFKVHARSLYQSDDDCLMLFLLLLLVMHAYQCISI